MIGFYIPRLSELGFRQRLLSDPATMRYNKGYGLSFPGYHNDTGCIDFPREDWDGWRREQMEKSLPLYESAFSRGMGLAGRTYRNY